ncbi:MAG TPA: hypothetical protein VG738_24860 [Chitinophagaceae bacterium]|nr:hypothetical protein [Chitinophagaceae bacterium]
MNNLPISRVAVVLFAIVIAFFGLYHFIDPENLVTFVPDYMPKGHVMVYAVGTVLILTSASILLNRQVKLVCYVLALLLVVFALAVHLQGYLSLSDKQMKVLSLMNMTQGLALACCVFYVGATVKPRHAAEKSAAARMTGAMSV